MPNAGARVRSTRFQGKPWTRSRLRDQMGPDKPIFHLLEDLCIQDVFSFEDDFVGVLNGDYWAASANGTSSAAFVQVNNALGGQLIGTTGTDDAGYSRLFTTNAECWQTEYRPIALTRLLPGATITTSKFEFGFASALQTGQVLVKATPTSTGPDYAVICRDTNDSTNIDLVGDGTTPAIAKNTGSSVTWTASTWHSLMLAINEQNESHYWVNGQYGGKVSSGPDDAVTLGLWLFVQARAGSASRTLTVDYIKTACDRVSSP